MTHVNVTDLNNTSVLSQVHVKVLN